nr:hypothetical protein [Vagococcus luciliae]
MIFFKQKQSSSDCIDKYNQLLRIEDQLGEIAEYNGLKSFYNLKKQIIND